MPEIKIEETCCLHLKSDKEHPRRTYITDILEKCRSSLLSESRTDHTWNRFDKLPAAYMYFHNFNKTFNLTLKDEVNSHVPYYL